jgi:hypothetical protein
VAQRRLGDPEGGVNVGFKRRVKIFRGQLFKRFTELLTAGVIDQNIQPAQLRDGFFDQILTEGFVPDVPGSAIALRPSASIRSMTSAASFSSSGR